MDKETFHPTETSFSLYYITVAPSELFSVLEKALQTSVQDQVQMVETRSHAANAGMPQT